MSGFRSDCAAVWRSELSTGRSRALRTILSTVFKLVVTNFFDDFCQLEVSVLRQSAWSTAETVMSLVGWSISVGDDQRKPFEKVFDILGAVVGSTVVDF